MSALKKNPSLTSPVEHPLGLADFYVFPPCGRPPLFQPFSSARKPYLSLRRPLASKEIFGLGVGERVPLFLFPHEKRMFPGCDRHPHIDYYSLMDLWKRIPPLSFRALLPILNVPRLVFSLPSGRALLKVPTTRLVRPSSSVPTFLLEDLPGPF